MNAQAALLSKNVNKYSGKKIEEKTSRLTLFLAYVSETRNFSEPSNTRQIRPALGNSCNFAHIKETLHDFVQVFDNEKVVFSIQYRSQKFQIFGQRLRQI